MAFTAVVHGMVGRLIIVHNTAIQLIPNFYLAPALLAADRKQNFNAVHRPAYLSAMLVSIVIELVWNALHPKALSPRLCGSLLALSSFVFSIERLGVYGALPGDSYTHDVSRGLQLLAWVLAIPTTQLGSLWTVNSPSESQSRYRMLGWIFVCALGLIALEVSYMATQWVVVVLAAVPSALLSLVLITLSDEPLSGRPGTLPRTAGSADPRTAISFFLAGVLIGTNGEALLDTFVGIRTRQSLLLARWNQAAVLLAMMCAYLSETRLMQASMRKRSRAYATVWALSQLVRVATLTRITDQSGQLVFSLVLMDKFTGPLGGAAVEMALLSLMHSQVYGDGMRRSPRLAAKAQAAMLRESTGRIPFAWLMTLRSVIETTSRPFMELQVLPALLRLGPGSVEATAAILTSLATLFVWFELCRS